MEEIPLKIPHFCAKSFGSKIIIMCDRLFSVVLASIFLYVAIFYVGTTKSQKSVASLFLLEATIGNLFT